MSGHVAPRGTRVAEVAVGLGRCVSDPRSSCSPSPRRARAARPGCRATEAPPTPANFNALDISDCAEIWLTWTESFDNQTPQAGIAYEIYVNSVFDSTVVGDDRAIVYGHGGHNTLALIAVDGAGNRSAPANAEVTLCE